MNTLQKKSAIKKGALASKPAQEQLPQNDILATVPQMEEHYETTPSVIINEIDMDQVLMTEPAQNDLQRMLSMSFYERRKTPSPGIRKNETTPRGLNLKAPVSLNKRESFPLPVQNPLAKPANRKTSEPKTSPTQQKTKPNDQKPPTLPIEKIEEEPHTAEKSKPLASPRNVNSRESLAKTSLKPKEMTAKVSLNNPTANTNLAESKKVEEKKTLSRSFLNSASSNIKRESNPNPKFTQKTLLTKTKEIKLDKSKTTKPLDSKRSMQISFTNSISEFHENEVNDIAKKLTPKMSIKKVGMSPDRFPTQCPERLVTLPETFETHKTLGSDRDFSAEAAKRFSTTPLKPLRENETKDKKDLQNILSAKRDQTTIPSDDERAQKFFQESTMDSIEGSKVFKDKENASKPGTNIHSFAGINIINAITVTPVIGVNNPYQKSPKNQTSPKAFGTTAPNFAHTATSAVRTPNHKPISSLKPTKQPARSNSKRSEEREVGKALSSRLTMGSFVETSKNTVSPEPKRLTPKGNDTLSKLGKKAATQISLKATMSPKASSTSNKYPVGKFVQKTGVTLIADSNSTNENVTVQAPRERSIGRLLSAK